MVEEKKKPNQFWKSNVWTAPKSNNKPLEFMHKPAAVAEHKPMFNSKPHPNIFTQSKPIRFIKGDGRMSEPATETPVVKTIIYPPTEGNGRVAVPRRKKKKIKYTFGAAPDYYTKPKKRRSMNKKQLKHFLTRYERDPRFRNKVRTRFLGDGALQKPDANKPAWIFKSDWYNGPENWKRITEGKCATCGGPIVESEFHPIEKKEYSISGMCPKCQRTVFGDGDGSGDGRTEKRSTYDWDKLTPQQKAKLKRSMSRNIRSAMRKIEKMDKGEVSQETIQKYKMTQPENETIEIAEEYRDESKRVI